MPHSDIPRRCTEKGVRLSELTRRVNRAENIELGVQSESFEDNKSSQPPATTREQHGIVPEERPSPLAYWIELYPLDSLVHGQIPDVPPEPASLYLDLHPVADGSIPEEPPSPQFNWIDLHLMDDFRECVPELAPEPTSLLVDLHPEDTSLNVSKVSPSDL